MGAPRRRLTAPGVAVAAGALALAAINVAWLLHFRSGYVTEWDESGYIALALGDTDALQADGPIGLADAVLSEGIQAPLVPLSAVPLHLLFGETVDASLVTIPIFAALLVLATYGLGRRLTTPGWAALAALCVGTAPIVIDFSRLFHFALPAAALATSAMWALLRSDDLSKRGWAVAFGVLVGLMALARTMTLAFLPGLAAAALALVLLAPGPWRPRVVNLVLSGLAAAVVAGSWYLPNIRSVGHYLLNFGYGTESSAYGTDRSPLSPRFWTRELDLLLDGLGLPLAVGIGLAVALGAWVAIGRRLAGIRDRLASSATARSVLAVALFVVAGYVAVSSSRNVGTAFGLPWVPALIALAVAGLSRVPARALRYGVAALLVAVSVANVVVKADLFEPTSETVRWDVPLVGVTTVIDGRGLIHREVSGAGYEIPNPSEELPPLHRRWIPAAERLSAFISGWAESHGDADPMVGYGFDDPLFSNTRIRLGARLALDRLLRGVFLKPFPHGDTPASYRQQLREVKADFLVTGPRRPGITPGIALTRGDVEAAGRELGFERVGRFRLPDGRPIVIWWRERPGRGV